MRENNSEERRLQVANINKGKTLSKETRELTRKSALLLLFSLEKKKKMRV